MGLSLVQKILARAAGRASVDEGEIGWAIEHGAVDNAERVIREIYATQEELRMEMGREARRMDDREFSKQILCGRFADVVEHGPQVDPA